MRGATSPICVSSITKSTTRLRKWMRLRCARTTRVPGGRPRGMSRWIEHGTFVSATVAKGRAFGARSRSWVVRLSTTALNPDLPPTGKATAAQSLVGHGRDEILNEWSLMRAFRTLDTDGDGVLSREELFEAIGNQVTKEEFEMIMTDFDTNGDGKLQYDEMAKAWASLGLTTSLINGQIFDNEREKRQLLTGVVSDELPELLPPAAKGATFKPFTKDWIVISADGGGQPDKLLRPGPGQKDNQSGQRNAPYDMDGPTPWHPPIGSEFGYDFLSAKVVHGVKFAISPKSTCTRGS